MSIFDGILGNLGNVPLLGTELNRVAINHIAASTSPRPRPFSLWSNLPVAPGSDTGPVSDYTTWPGLTDRSFSGRHLPPAEPRPEGYAPLNDVAALFKRTKPMIPSRSSVLFTFFAQWFTDSVLRISPADRRRNTSNHDIDLCQIYGLTEDTARLLRSMEGGKLRCQTIGGASYLEYLYEQGDGAPQVKAHFRQLPYADKLDAVFEREGVPLERRRKAYATGLERGNSSIGYVAISTLFMREHNRICDQLAARNPAWDDERLFQTARMINIVLLMKIVVEEYINHIAGAKIFRLDHDFAERQDWYRTNWIAVEFDLLYRWHSLVPDEMVIGGKKVESTDFRNNNALLEQQGLSAVLGSASVQQAGRIGLFNTPDFLMRAELNSLKMARDFRLRPYNEYREQFGLPALESIDQLTADPVARQHITNLYGSIDNVEFLVGVFAEDRSPGSLFGSLLTTMVAYDALTQIFTNPLLSRNVYNEQTFSAYGIELIAHTASVQDIARRHLGPEVRTSLGA